jgi:hypothetical protein
MGQSVGEFVLARLRDQWGVRRVYGYPGDGLSGVIGAFQRLGGSPELMSGCDTLLSRLELPIRRLAARRGSGAPEIRAMRPLSRCRRFRTLGMRSSWG